MTEPVPIEISDKGRNKADRLLPTNEVRQRLWDFEHPLYLEVPESAYHLVGDDGMIIIFKITQEPRFRIIVVTQCHKHHQYEHEDRFELQGGYTSAWEVAWDVAG